MNEAVPLQILHPFTDILAHAQQPLPGKWSPSVSEIAQQAAVLHKLGDDVQRLLLYAHSIELHQPGMRQLPVEEKHTPVSRLVLHLKVLRLNGWYLPTLRNFWHQDTRKMNPTTEKVEQFPFHCARWISGVKSSSTPQVTAHTECYELHMLFFLLFILWASLWLPHYCFSLLGS